ncbi:hypothetical protein SCUP234_11203 [Seiridium cupressi]
MKLSLFLLAISGVAALPHVWRRDNVSSTPSEVAISSTRVWRRGNSSSTSSEVDDFSTTSVAATTTAGIGRFTVPEWAPAFTGSWTTDLNPSSAAPVTWEAGSTSLVTSTESLSTTASSIASTTSGRNSTTSHAVSSTTATISTSSTSVSTSTTTKSTKTSTSAGTTTTSSAFTLSSSATTASTTSAVSSSTTSETSESICEAETSTTSATISSTETSSAPNVWPTGGYIPHSHFVPTGFFPRYDYRYAHKTVTWLGPTGFASATIKPTGGWHR